MPVLSGTPCYQSVWGIKLKKFKKELSVLFIRQQITKMLSTSLNASALSTDVKSYVLKH
ncbi:Hypothetical predicted protein [Paramuricea clavata]|uniref:Uncharacterized protein n=1 Tax=Paramuricea clavata TaxID=317549 RepID=A0A7D9KLT4_PARCT|nr:Hypothetical predicted protein [Paramuricea clavata]